MVVARRAGCDKVGPVVNASQVPWDDVIHSQHGGCFSTILAGKMVAAENLAPRKRDARAGRMHHARQADDGGDGEGVVR